MSQNSTKLTENPPVGLAARAITYRDASRSVVAESRQDPRIVTRGSFLGKHLNGKEKSERAPSSDPDLTDLVAAFFFDWFQVTIPNREGKAQCVVGSPEEREAVDTALLWAKQQGLHPGRVSGGHNGYRAALPLTAGPESLENVMQINSGSSSGIMPNIMLTGGHGACSRLAPKLQKAFPGARLSRADAALDWSQEGLFDDLLIMARKLARGNAKLGGVRTIESDTGRTFYLGSRTSTVSLRVYEKDRERAARGVIDPDDVDPDLIRIEWTFRPQSKSKAGMAKLSPGQMIRSSVWARDFMARASRVMRVTDRTEWLYRQDVEREVAEKTLQGTVEHGVKQYARSFTRLAAARIVEREHGGHYDTAVVDPDEVSTEAVAIFADLLSQSDASVRVVLEERLDSAMDPDAWRQSYVDEMMDAPEREAVARDHAQGRMTAAMAVKGMVAA